MNGTVPAPRRFLAALLLCIFTLFAQNAPAGQDAAKATKGVTIEGITEYRLENGLKCLLFPDPSSSKVTVNMTVLVGSRHEGYGETGMAHLLEHMLFKGSKNFPEIDKVMQEHGADYNGTTWTDRTNYYETMPASDDNLAFGIKLEADRLVNSFVKREDLTKEMTVVRNEFEMGENNPEYILSQRINAVAYEWHNYGKSTIGNRSDIERVPIDRLQGFYKKYYQPDNVVLVLAGRFDEAKAVAIITKHFGAIPAPRRTLEKTYTDEPPQDGERSVLLRRVGKVAVVGAAYHIPAAAHEDHPAVEVLSSVLGDTPSGRLYKALVEAKLATRISADASAYHDPGLLEISARVADGITAEKVRDVTVDVVENVAAKPVTKEEVERAKGRYLSARERALTSSQTIALELSEWAGAGDWRQLFIHRDRVAKVTPEDVNRVAAKYLKQTNRTVGIFMPTTPGEFARASIPGAPDVAQLVKDYKGGKSLAAGETFDPTPENIEKRVKRLTLSTGVKVAFLHKKTRGEKVVGRVVLRFGNEKSLKDYVTTSGILGPLTMRGTKQRTREQITDELDKLKSTLNASSDLGTLTFSLESKRGQLPQVLSLLREVLREPTFPEKEFEVLKRNRKQGVEKSMVEPTALAVNSLTRQLSPYAKDNIRYVPTYEESLARLAGVTRNDVVRLYQEQLGSNYGEVVLVGDVDADSATRLLEEIFAGWKNGVPYERIPQKVIPGIKANRETIQTPDKENAMYVAGLMFEMRDTDPDYAAVTLGNYVLGGSGFTSRLMDRLRQKEGWSYGAGSQLQVESQDKVAVFVAYAICNPQVIDKVDTGAAEEIARMLKEGVKADELKAARKGYLEELKVSRGSDSTLAGMLQRGLNLGRTFDFHADLDKKIAALDVDQVNSALRRHLDAGRLVVVRAGDFKKAPATPQK
jgi:zinc protease